MDGVERSAAHAVATGHMKVHGVKIRDMVHPRQSALQRIQVGLIGLVVVLLFVSLANMVLDQVVDVPSKGPSGGGITGTEIATEAKGTPNAPLAELGVTPVADKTGALEAGALKTKASPTPPQPVQ
jgi:hypothetical protein